MNRRFLVSAPMERFRAKFSFLICIAAGTLFFSCSKPQKWPEGTYWMFRTREFPDAVLYAGHSENTLYAVVVGEFDGIKGHVVLTHESTGEQFENALVCLEKMGGEKIGKTEKIKFNRRKYPDHSIYITWVLSYDEREALWKSLGFDGED